MKLLFSYLVIFLISLTGYTQSVVYLRADTVIVEKSGSQNAELKIKNSTRNTKGVLTNIGGGITQFIVSRKVGDTLFIGRDTITGIGSGGSEEILIVDTVTYTHSSSELDTLTLAELAGKTVLSAEVHPYNLHLSESYPPSTSDIWINNATGGVKFGTPLQNGQTVTFLYKYIITSGVPLVESIQVNGDPPQTGTVSISVPEQFNPIAGTNISLSGTYPDITFNASGGSGSPKAGKSIRISGSDTVNNRVDVSDSSYAVLAGVLRGTFDTTTSQNTWAWIANSDHGNINIKDSVVVTGTGVQVFYDSSTYHKVVTFLIVPDETASRIAQTTASFQGKAGALFWSNGGYRAGASVGLTSATISFSSPRGLSVLVHYNGSSWVMTNNGQNAINFNSTSPTISYSAGRLRIQSLPFNMKTFPTAMTYAPSGDATLLGYHPGIEYISDNWVDVYWYDIAGHAKYTSATPATNLGVYLNFGQTFALCNPQTEDMGFNSNWWVIAIMKKTL